MLLLNSGVARMHASRNEVRRQLDSLGIYSELHPFPEAPRPCPLLNSWVKLTLQYTVALLKQGFRRPVDCQSGNQLAWAASLLVPDAHRRKATEI